MTHGSRPLGLASPSPSGSATSGLDHAAGLLRLQRPGQAPHPEEDTDLAANLWTTAALSAGTTTSAKATWTPPSTPGNSTGPQCATSNSHRGYSTPRRPACPFPRPARRRRRASGQRWPSLTPTSHRRQVQATAHRRRQRTTTTRPGRPSRQMICRHRHRHRHRHSRRPAPQPANAIGQRRKGRDPEPSTQNPRQRLPHIIIPQCSLRLFGGDRDAPGSRRAAPRSRA